ncbi:hypothetical protein BXZ70DRAFT_468351 [Cristinia sonorae]|uniref:Uncharacterized protein n=1 Tax=Cristinia sonorae TaxID=1940300 RepID=A0A8K0XLV3_9AGAR|nr:hypothetical protein BXZ70DRAFT_468351 [Cristinia sonorae]
MYRIAPAHQDRMIMTIRLPPPDYPPLYHHPTLTMILASLRLQPHKMEKKTKALPPKELLPLLTPETLNHLSLSGLVLLNLTTKTLFRGNLYKMQLRKLPAAAHIIFSLPLQLSQKCLRLARKPQPSLLRICMTGIQSSHPFTQRQHLLDVLSLLAYAVCLIPCHRTSIMMMCSLVLFLTVFFLVVLDLLLVIRYRQPRSTLLALLWKCWPKFLRLLPLESLLEF